MDSALKTILTIAKQLLTSLRKSNGVGLLGAVAKFEPLFARTYYDTLLANHLSAAREAADKANIDPGDPGSFTIPFRPPGDPIVRFPIIETAARDLFGRGVFTLDDYRSLDQDSRRAAFTLARVQSAGVIQQVRDALAQNVQDGGTLKDFRDAIQDLSAFDPSQIETTYRTQSAQAYSAGQRAVLEHPLVSDLVPYVLWSATHDSRVRPDHLEMESFGQNGSGVYRADDPIWQVLYPPAHYNCRCVLIPLTVADAARHGSLEAAEWLRTGEPPAQPNWVSPPYPILPPKDWPIHRRVQSVL